MSLSNSALWVGPVFLVLLFAGLAGAEIRRPLRAFTRSGSERIFTNFTLGAVNYVLVAFAPISSVLAAAWAHDHDVGLLNLWPVAAWLAAVLTLLGYSLFAYLFHRASHRVALLWRFHRVHHCDVALDVSTAFRNHPGEAVLLILGLGAFALAFGASPAAIALYEAAVFGWNIAAHANIRLPAVLETWLSGWLTTPAVHAVHHSSLRDETDSNYGEIVMLWDRLFGTYRRGRPERIGLGPDWDATASRMTAVLLSPLRPDPARNPAAEVA